jgi:cobyrinic acid a,c-diamide synthase
VIGAPSSGAGKTTVATGLMVALRNRGVRVASAKVGPDFIDPGYHALATGRPGRNLDAWISGAEHLPALAARAATDSDVLVVEGVMGLFDGAADPEDPDIASTAQCARLLQAPVVLVVDAAAVSRSVAATVSGFVHFDPRVEVAGVVLNRVGSDGHEVLLREAIAPLGVPVLGALRRDDAFAWRDRHLGLVPVVEQTGAVTGSLVRLGAAIEAQCDVDGLLALAGRAPPMVPPELPRPRPAASGVRIGVAGGPAFSFVYPDNLEALTAAGAELVPFDPQVDASLPEALDGLYVGGGFPEVFAAELAGNTSLLAGARSAVREGLVTLAECGGLLWLARSLDGHPMAGALAAEAAMTDRLSLGYRRAVARVDTPVAKAGAELRGHEFHYSQTTPPGDALELSGRFGRGTAGFATPTLLASYLHLHFGGDPGPAERFVRTAGKV